MSATTAMTPTPRVDAARFYAEKWSVAPSDVFNVESVEASLARQLERELATAQQQLHAMRLVCGTTDANKFETTVDRLVMENAELRKAAAKALNATGPTPWDHPDACGPECQSDYGSWGRRKRTDKERIDWLDENMGYSGGGRGGTYTFRTPADVECGMLREAIDAAMAKDKEDAP